MPLNANLFRDSVSMNSYALRTNTKSPRGGDLKMNASDSPNDPWVVFDYEVDMFRNLYQLLATGNPQYQGLSHYIKNAIVESAVLHTRILVGILLSRGPEPDDI